MWTMSGPWGYTMRWMQLFSVYFSCSIFRADDFLLPDFSHHMFSFCLYSPPLGLILAVPLLSLWSPCLFSNSLMGVLREEADVLNPDCMENSSKRHEAKSLNQGDWLLFPLSSSWTTIDDCPQGLGGWQCLIGWLFLRPCVGACKCGIVGSAIVRSSFRQGLIPTWKRCWAGVQEQRQGGAPGSPGDPISKQRNSVTESGYLFVCRYLNTADIWNNKTQSTSGSIWDTVHV